MSKADALLGCWIGGSLFLAIFFAAFGYVFSENGWAVAKTAGIVFGLLAALLCGVAVAFYLTVVKQ